ncbi:UNC93-like protein MFSD11 [Aphelenchoides besseyi]|nr:UNC93-like protein MFSD11 [Aphelenchoides besseyi]
MFVLSQHKTTVNVIHLGIAFFFIFFAFCSCSFIEEIVISTLSEERNLSKHAGYNSLAIIYALFTVCNFIAPTIIYTIGPKWSLVLSSSTYAIFQAGFLFLNEIFLYISSALLGFGAAILWASQGTYLSLNSDEKTAGLHSGIFYAISQLCLICGGIYLCVIFLPGETETTKIDDFTIYLLYGVFTVVTIVAIILLSFLRMPKEKPKPKIPQAQLFKSLFELMATKPIFCLLITSGFTGMQLSFWSGVYPSSIGFTQKLHTNTRIIVALNAIAQGSGQATGGFLFGILSSKIRKLSRECVVLISTFIYLFVSAVIYINLPLDAPFAPTDQIGIIEPKIWIALTCGYFLGVGDAILNTQITSFIITKYTEQNTEVFSLYKFSQHFFAFAGFFYGPRLHLGYQLTLLAVGSVVGCVAFFLAEYSTKKTETVEIVKN